MIELYINGRPIVSRMWSIKRCLTPISRSQDYFTLNISETVKDTTIVATERE